MRLIYVDEAGTSAKEPVSVVAAVIVDADDQLRSVVDALASLIKSGVPRIYQEGFVFHAKEMFSGGRRISRDVWSFQDRLGFYKGVLGIPLIHQLPIAMALSQRGAFGPDVYGPVSPKIAPHQIDHISAFMCCVEKADYFLRKYLKRREVGVVIAEDVTELRSYLSKMSLWYRDKPVVTAAEHLIPNAYQKRMGIKPADYTYLITNIIDCPHFVSKNQAPITQLADACAFAFRRWLSEQSHGEDLMFAMLGPEAPSVVFDRVWFDTPGSSGLFNTLAYRNQA